MSYLAFLLIFLLPPICLLLFALRAHRDRLPWRTLALTAGAALLYTAPWDNAIIRAGVWSYSPSHVIGVRIGEVPLEEYLFYLLQVTLTGLFAWWLLRRDGAARG